MGSPMLIGILMQTVETFPDSDESLFHRIIWVNQGQTAGKICNARKRNITMRGCGVQEWAIRFVEKVSAIISALNQFSNNKS
jgi:hypothetical protein